MNDVLRTFHFFFFIIIDRAMSLRHEQRREISAEPSCEKFYYIVKLSDPFFIYLHWNWIWKYMYKNIEISGSKFPSTCLGPCQP